MSSNPLDHVPVTLESHPASMPLALGIGGFVFVACVIGGQLTWRNMRRLLRRSFFQHTSCIGEPTLVGISAGLLFGISIGLGIFYGIEPQLLYHVEAVSAIATVLSLLTCGACCFGWLCVLNLDCGLDGTRSWEVVVLCLVPCCCSMTGAIGVGAALGYGLKSRVNYKANAAIQFTQQSIAIGAVVAILLALCLGFCLFNMTRLRRQHRNLYQRRDVLRAIPQDPEQAHMMWFREARMALVMGLHPKVGEKSVLYKQLMHGDIAEPKILGHVFELLGYDSVNLDNNCYPVDEAALQSQRHPQYTRPVTILRQAAQVAGLPVPPSLANIGLGDDENNANEADYEMQSLAVDNDRIDRDGLHYRGSSAATFAPTAGISGPMMASLHGVSGVAGPGYGNNAPISGIAGPTSTWGPTLHMDGGGDDHKYERRDSTDYMFHVRDDDKGETKRGVPILAPPPGDFKIDMNTNSSSGSTSIMAGVGGPAFANLLTSSSSPPPIASNSIAITIHDSKQTDMKRTTIMIPPPPLPSPASPPRISPSAKFRTANMSMATAAPIPPAPLPHISSSLLTTRHHSNSVIDPTETGDGDDNNDDNDNTLVSSSSSSQILPPLLAPSSISSLSSSSIPNNNNDSPTPLSSSGGGASMTAAAAAATPSTDHYTPSSISHHRLHSNSDVSNGNVSPRHPHPSAHSHGHHGAASSMDSGQLLRIIPLTVTSSGNDNSPSPETPSTRAAAANGGGTTPLSAASAASSSTTSATRGSFSGIPLVPIVERNDDERQS